MPGPARRHELLKLKSVNAASVHSQYWVWASMEAPEHADLYRSMQGIFNISQTYSLVSRFMLEASNESTG
jgi:hypothetical protein